MANPVIIRLQNLPLEARSIDIRKFFDGLLIPDGGVHIIGGEKGIAFIAFQSDEDARLAMARDGGTIFSSHVKLYLSSKTEMQNVIASARNSQTATATATSIAPSLPFNLASAVPDLRSTNLDLITSLASLISTTNAKASSNLLGAGKPFENDPKSSTGGIDLLKSVIQGDVLNKPKEDITQAPFSVDQILNLIQNRMQPEALKAATSDLADKNFSNSFNDVKRALNEKMDEARRGSADVYGSSSSDFSHGGGGGGNGRDNGQYEPKQGGRYNQQGNDYGDRQRPFYKNQQFDKFDKFDKYGGGKNGNNNNNNNFYDNGKPSKRFNQGGSFSGPGNNDYDDSKNFSRSNKTRLDPIILVKNFNRNSGYKDIRTFLQGIQIEHDGIKLMTDSTGHRIGMALVKLMTIIDLKKALCRNGQFYEDNMIEVIQSSEDEFENPMPNVKPNKPMKDGPSSNNNNFNPHQSFHDKRRMNDYYNNSRSDDNPNNNRGDADSDLSAHGFFLKIYGLPAKFEESALKNIFNNVKFLQIFTTTPIAFKSNNPVDGEARTTYKAKKICQVDTQLDLEKALTRQDERVGKSKLQIYQISKAEFDREIAHAQKNPSNFNDMPGDNDNEESYNDNEGGPRSNEPNSYNNDRQQQQQQQQQQQNQQQQQLQQQSSRAPTGEEAFLHMTGVPFSAHEMDVKAFFQGLELAKITILHDTQTCKPTGDVCCSFVSKQDRDKGLEKDNQLFRNRVVKIKAIELDDYQQYLNQEQEVKGKMKPKQFHNDDPVFYKKNYNDFNNYGNNSKFNKNNNGGGSFQNFNSNYQYNKFNRNANNNNNNGGNGGGPNNKFNDFNRLKRREADGDDRNGNLAAKRIKESNNNDIAVVDLPPLPPELEQHRDSLVLLNNVTREATREDILDLFKIYSPIEQSLKIRHNEDGEPTGDVIIACKTPANASKACRFLNGYAFMGRPITASLIAS